MSVYFFTWNPFSALIFPKNSCSKSNVRKWQIWRFSFSLGWICYISFKLFLGASLIFYLSDQASDYSGLSCVWLQMKHVLFSAQTAVLTRRQALAAPARWWTACQSFPDQTRQRSVVWRAVSSPSFPAEETQRNHKCYCCSLEGAGWERGSVLDRLCLCLFSCEDDVNWRRWQTCTQLKTFDLHHRNGGQQRGVWFKPPRHLIKGEVSIQAEAEAAAAAEAGTAECVTVFIWGSPLWTET